MRKGTTNQHHDQAIITIILHQEAIREIHLHSFGDASGKSVAAVVYAVVFQSARGSQGMIAAKSRMAKQRLTILG